MNTKIIGIAGTNGAGKDTAGQILADKFGYLFLSMTDVLRDEARRRGLEISRESLRTISAEWRRESGLGVLIDKAIAQYEQQKAQYAGLAMASLRNPGEADRVHELGGIVLWVDAEPRIRYDRVQVNAASRNRAEEDNKTFEQFLAEEQAEMHTSGDAATLDMAAVQTKADLSIDNNFEAPAELGQELARKLGL